MKKADLKVGEIYALGASSSRYLKGVGVLLSLDPYRSPNRWDKSRALTLSPNRPEKFQGLSWGLPVLTLKLYQEPETLAAEVSALDLSKVKYVQGEQHFGGRKYQIDLVPLMLIKSPYAEWHRVEAERDAAAKAARKAADQRTLRNDAVAKEIKKLLPESLSASFNVRADSGPYDKGSVHIRDLAAFLDFLKGRS